jgi:hypothetical protein
MSASWADPTLRARILCSWVHIPLKGGRRKRDAFGRARMSPSIRRDVEVLPTQMRLRSHFGLRLRLHDVPALPSVYLITTISVGALRADRPSKLRVSTWRPPEPLDRLRVGVPASVDVGSEDGVEFASRLLVDFGSTTPTICIPSFIV